jgi:hypothetical protein
MKMTSSISTLLASIGLAILLINCKGQTNKNLKKMETFKWDPSVCAPKMYPVELYTGDFYFENGGSIYISKYSFEHGGWGEIGSTDVTGSGTSPVPVRLELTWISYTEGKFYTGNFTLPKDSMTQLFKEGFTRFDDKEHGTYEDIIVGLAPGGIVVVWMRGIGRSVEIGRYQASERKVPIKAFVPDADVKTVDEWVNIVMQEAPEIKDYVKKHGFQYGLWDTYREKFNFRPVVDFDDKENQVMDEIYMEFFNGEHDAISVERLTTNPFEKHARIQKLEFQWSNRRKLWEAEINLDEEEIFKAYRFIYQDNPDQEGQFRIKINKDDSHIWIFLENTDPKNHREVQLQRARIKIYPMRESHREDFTRFKGEFKKKQ